MLERLADEAGQLLRMRMRVGGFDSIAALVAQNLGIGVMPAAIARHVAGGARFARLPIRGDWARRQFVLCHRAPETLSRAAAGVARVLADTQTANPASPK
jgi:DNA-binding transcriptional LysR family regulator